jgi:hypothetical protein
MHDRCGHTPATFALDNRAKTRAIAEYRVIAMTRYSENANECDANAERAAKADAN